MENPDKKNLDYDLGTASAVDMHDSTRRENDLLPVGDAKTGFTVFLIGAVVLVLGGGYLFSNVNGFSDSIYSNRFYQPEPRPTLDSELTETVEVAWIDDWMSDGKKVYGNCIACHQSSGLGIPGAFPPLVGSEWVDGGSARLGAILLHGVNGPMKVGGQTYNGLMPAWNSLSDEKIAQVITYIQREFGSLPEGNDGVVTVEMMKAAREEFAGQTGPYTEAELLAIPADAMLPGAKVDLETGEPAS